MPNSYSVYNTIQGNKQTYDGTVGSDSNAPTIPSITNPSGTSYSMPWSGRLADGYGLHVNYTGTLTGTFTLWMSDKQKPSLADDTDWVQDTGFAPTNPAGSAGKFRDDTSNAKSEWKRLKYVQSSGSGTITAYVSVPRTA